MEDHSVGPLLRALPRETARPGFTQRVLRRLDEARGRDAKAAALPTEKLPRPAFAAMAVVAILVFSAGAFWYEQSREAARNAEARRLLQEIRAEHGRLERELHDLSAPPVVYLGGDERMDLVVDLSNVPAEDGPAPATYRLDTF